MNMNFQRLDSFEPDSVLRKRLRTHQLFNDNRSIAWKRLGKRLLWVGLATGIAYTLLSVSVKLLLIVVGVLAALIAFAIIVSVYALNNTPAY